MSKIGLLTNKEFQIDGGWHAPAEYLRSFKSVKQVKYLDTTSSAGDWSGLLIQKLRNRTYLIGFCQENNFPRGGFTLYIGDIETTFEGDITPEQYASIQNTFCESFYL